MLEVPNIAEFIATTQEQTAQAQAELAQLAKQRGVALDGVRALEIDYEKVALDDDETLHALARIHQRHNAAQQQAYDVAPHTQEGKTATRKAPLKAI